MTASILNGKQLADTLELEIQQTVGERVAEGHVVPGLAVICVGDDKPSQIYVNHKRKACQRVGIQSFAYDLPASVSESELIQLIQRLNEDPVIHGLLVQLPLPAHIRVQAVIESIDPRKDVDGFHPENLGRLAQGYPGLRPCTPYGIIQLLSFYQRPMYGQHAVIVGASNIVGKPMAFELLLQKATVTVCHRQTHNLAFHIRSADIVIVAAGVLDVVHPDWLQATQTVVDVGMHRSSQGHVRGDVDFKQAKEKVAAITPVPYGVGPMTIVTLLQNTLYAHIANIIMLD